MEHTPWDFGQRFCTIVTFNLSCVCVCICEGGGGAGCKTTYTEKQTYKCHDPIKVKTIELMNEVGCLQTYQWRDVWVNNENAQYYQYMYGRFGNHIIYHTSFYTVNILKPPLVSSCWSLYFLFLFKGLEVSGGLIWPGDRRCPLPHRQDHSCLKQRICPVWNNLLSISWKSNPAAMYNNHTRNL